MVKGPVYHGNEQSDLEGSSFFRGHNSFGLYLEKEFGWGSKLGINQCYNVEMWNGKKIIFINSKICLHNGRKNLDNICLSI